MIKSCRGGEQTVNSEWNVRSFETAAGIDKEVHYVKLRCGFDFASVMRHTNAILLANICGWVVSLAIVHICKMGVTPILNQSRQNA